MKTVADQESKGRVVVLDIGMHGFQHTKAKIELDKVDKVNNDLDTAIRELEFGAK